MLLNLLVIHFAFGSPFGMYQITRGGGMRSARSAASVAAHFVLWPIFAAAFIRNWLTLNLKPAPNDIEQEIANIRTKFETLAFSDAKTASIFEFREVVGRFTELTMALIQNGSGDSAKDLFKIAGHTNLPLGLACMARRNRKRLSFHLDNARIEFGDLVSRIAGSHEHGPEIIDLALSLADLLDDRLFTKYLSAIHDISGTKYFPNSGQSSTNSPSAAAGIQL